MENLPFPYYLVVSEGFLGFRLDFLFRADILEVFGRQVVGHLVAVDNPRCIVDIRTVIKRNLNLVQGCSWEARSRDDILVTRDFLDDGIDKS